MPLKSIFIIVFIAMGTFQAGMAHYQPDKPDKIVVLPDVLREISGICFIDSTRLACVQDENGKVFIYDIKTSKITSDIFIKEKGDFEDIALVENTIYLLRSDGSLFTFIPGQSGKAEKSRSGIKNKESEALCFDPFAHKLLLVPKAKSEKKKFHNEIQFYYIHWKNLKIEKKPFLTVDVKSVRNFLEKKDLPRYQEVLEWEKKGKKWEFKVSAAAVHPLSGHFFVLSSVNHLWLEISRKGKIIDGGFLKTELYPQPEGLCFSPEGKLYISNEAVTGPATLLKISPTP